MDHSERTNLNTAEYWDRTYKKEAGETSEKLPINYHMDRLFYYRNYFELHHKMDKMIPKDAAVLDAGCGTGLLTRKLKESSPDRRIVGLDFSPFIIEKDMRRDEGLGIDYRVGDLRQDLPLDSDDEFDYIVLSEVLEHMEDPDQILQSLLMHLKQDGQLLINVPEGNKLDKMMTKAGTLGEHVNSWTLEELEEFLGKYGEVKIQKPSKILRFQVLAVTKPAWKTELKVDEPTETEQKRDRLAS